MKVSVAKTTLKKSKLFYTLRFTHIFVKAQSQKIICTFNCFLSYINVIKNVKIIISINLNYYNSNLINRKSKIGSLERKPPWVFRVLKILG